MKINELFEMSEMNEKDKWAKGNMFVIRVSHPLDENGIGHGNFINNP